MDSKQFDADLLVSRAIGSWQETREYTLDLLESLSEEQLSVPFPRPKFNSFGKQFLELGSIQRAYVDALEEGVVHFSRMSVDLDTELVSSKTLLHELLKEQDTRLYSILQDKPNPHTVIDWHLGDNNPFVFEHIYWMTQHETLHHGQLAAYLYLLGIDIPDSLSKAWALPPKDPEIVENWLRSWQAYVRL